MILLIIGIIISTIGFCMSFTEAVTYVNCMLTMGIATISTAVLSKSKGKMRKYNSLVRRLSLTVFIIVAICFGAIEIFTDYNSNWLSAMFSIVCGLLWSMFMQTYQDELDREFKN